MSSLRIHLEIFSRFFFLGHSSRSYFRNFSRFPKCANSNAIWKPWVASINFTMAALVIFMLSWLYSRCSSASQMGNHCSNSSHSVFFSNLTVKTHLQKTTALRLETDLTHFVRVAAGRIVKSCNAGCCPLSAVCCIINMHIMEQSLSLLLPAAGVVMLIPWHASRTFLPLCCIDNVLDVFGDLWFSSVPEMIYGRSYDVSFLLGVLKFATRSRIYCPCIVLELWLPPGIASPRAARQIVNAHVYEVCAVGQTYLDSSSVRYYNWQPIRATRQIELCVPMVYCFLWSSDRYRRACLLCEPSLTAFHAKAEQFRALFQPNHYCPMFMCFVR